jgi:alkanesulfonate monooxygenase SsuD/methylene tetrahydromethanopterin reductase-like flavin-dependent oxidoreductase (luciferase family)
MLHTFVGDNLNEVRDLVREPMKHYLASCVDLWRKNDQKLNKLLERPDGMEFAFQRYFSTSGLFGTVETCSERIRQLRKIGVNEVTCLIDYGVDASHVPQSLELLNQLRQGWVEHA